MTLASSGATPPSSFTMTTRLGTRLSLCISAVVSGDREQNDELRRSVRRGGDGAGPRGGHRANTELLDVGAMAMPNAEFVRARSTGHVARDRTGERSTIARTCGVMERSGWPKSRRLPARPERVISRASLGADGRRVRRFDDALGSAEASVPGRALADAPLSVLDRRLFDAPENAAARWSGRRFGHRAEPLEDAIDGTPQTCPRWPLPN